MDKKTLSNTVSRLNRERPLSVVFIDSGYWQVFENWYQYAQGYLQNNLLVVALDDNVSKLLHERGISTFLLEWSGNLNHLWVERVNIFKKLLGLGYDIIHSDADAVWLENPITYCESLDVEAAFSQGTIWPPKVHDQLGGVLCCGFFYLKSTPLTIDLMKEWGEAVLADGDDQRALNELLLSKGLSWHDKADYTLSWNGKNFRCFDKVQVSTLSNNIRLALLPHSLFQRLPEEKRAIVKHPLSEKNGVSTGEILRMNKCWFGL